MAQREWFKKAIDKRLPNTLGGWRKEMPADKRRADAIDSRPVRWSRSKKYLSAGRALQALSNVSTDAETKRIAKEDADYFFNKVKKQYGKGGEMKDEFLKEAKAVKSLKKKMNGIILNDGSVVDAQKLMKQGGKIYAYDGDTYTAQELIDFADTASEYDRRDASDNQEEYNENKITTIEEAIEFLGKDEVTKFDCGGDVPYGEGDIVLKDEGDFYVINSQTGKGLAWLIQKEYADGQTISPEEANNIINDQRHGMKVEVFSKGGIIGGIREFLMQKVTLKDFFK